MKEGLGVAVRPNRCLDSGMELNAASEDDPL
jgi:hypothetical protein